VHRNGLNQRRERLPHVRFGSRADICSATAHVRFTPNSDRKSGHPHKVMSALPPKADRCSAKRNVGYGPEADIRLFNHLVGRHQQIVRDGKSERFSCFQIDN
jgi:hypothetical protein